MKPSLEERQMSLFEQWNEASAIIHEMAEHPELAELEADDYVTEVRKAAKQSMLKK